MVYNPVKTSDDIPILKSWSFLQNAIFLYKQGVKNLDDKCYKDALNCFAEAKMPFEEGKRFYKRSSAFPAFLGKDECKAFRKELKSELSVLDQDLKLHTGMSNFIFAIFLW